MQTPRHGTVVAALVEPGEARWVILMSKSLYRVVARGVE